MKLSDFRNLDRNNIGGWPHGVKFVLCGVLFALLLLLGWWYSIKDKQDVLEQKQKQEVSLKSDFHTKQGKVVNLDKLKQQLDDMQEMIEQLKRQLPSKTEMPQLLIDVSQSALSAGLETQLFQPGAEVVKDGFYAEKPIQLRMLGNYHQFGAFISTVAALPRVVILTMHDVSLKPSEAKASAGKTLAPGQLALEGTVKTYRYVDDTEEQAAAKKAADQPKKPAPPPPPPPSEDLLDWVNHEKSLAGPPIQPLPVLKTFETFEYHDQGGRDPFAPSISEQKAAEVTEGAVPDPHPKEKLENYALDSLKMVGTLGSGGAMEALVKDPDGTVNRVHLHNYLGQNNGKIVAITPNRIELVEKISDGSGRYNDHTAAIELGGTK